MLYGESTLRLLLRDQKVCNIIDHTLPANAVPEAISSPIDAFELTFPLELVDTIMHYTNQCYQVYCQQFPRGSIVNQFHGYLPFTLEEIGAFIGLQFVSGADKMGFQPLPNLFTSLQVFHFRAAVSRDRQKLIYKFCRFNNIDIREEGQVNNKFCHVRELWDEFTEQSQSLYNLAPNATIDKMLLKFRGRCSFRQYMPSKPDGYGIKFQILAGAENHYCYNSFPYLVKGGDKMRHTQEQLW